MVQRGLQCNLASDMHENSLTAELLYAVLQQLFRRSYMITAVSSTLKISIYLEVLSLGVGLRAENFQKCLKFSDGALVHPFWVEYKGI